MQARLAFPLLRYWRAIFGLSARRSRRNREIVMLVVSNLRVDPRVERAARMAAAAGYDVKVICPDLCNPPLMEVPLDWGTGVTIHPLPADAATYVHGFPWLDGSALHERAIKERPFAFHCHDLTTAIVGLSAARTTGARCICDFHEWYSENVSWDNKNYKWIPHPTLKRTVYRWAERIAMWRADHVITVCDSIADELVAMAPGSRRPTVIRNIPPLAHSGTAYPSLRETLQLSADQFLVLWQGGVGPSRMIEPIIEALQYAPMAVFAIRGPGLDYYGESYRELAVRKGVEARLKLLDIVPSADVVSAAAGADAGVWTLPNLSKNFYYALPNKIFEYLAAGLPVLAANYPEARKMVEGNGVGLCFDPYDPKSIAQQITTLAQDAAMKQSMITAIPRVLQSIGADTEWQKLRQVYDALEST